MKKININIATILCAISCLFGCSVATQIEDVSQQIYDVLDTMSGSTPEIQAQLEATRERYHDRLDMTGEEKTTINTTGYYDKVLENEEKFLNLIDDYEGQTITPEDWNKINQRERTITRVTL